LPNIPTDGDLIFQAFLRHSFIIVLSKQSKPSTLLSDLPIGKALEQAQRLPRIPRQGLSKSITIDMENEEETPPKSAIVKVFQSLVKSNQKLKPKL
jgi:hypothetical protein